MTATYFDANALVKLVLIESDSDLADTIWLDSSERHASLLSYVEACAALAAAHRNHQVDEHRHQAALSKVEQIRVGLHDVQLTSNVATDAATLAREHALKGADAVHLASALALRDRGLVFATWDRRLHEAAQTVGLRVAPAALAG